jgi:hypothetical protein
VDARSKNQIAVAGYQHRSCSRHGAQERLHCSRLSAVTCTPSQDPHVDSLVLDLDPRSLLELARAAGAVPTTTAPPSSVCSYVSLSLLSVECCA